MNRRGVIDTIIDNIDESNVIDVDVGVSHEFPHRMEYTISGIISTPISKYKTKTNNKRRILL